jgi:hypothetical protein
MMNQSSGIPVVGTKVVTMDGDELGKVKEISGDCFKVDARLQPDYWLGVDTIETTLPGEVRLRFTKGGLGDAKQEGPEHSGFHPHSSN